ncbi:hypothetical protein WME73_00440 [Sorangium sp. So ce302]|uniref:hypothetical protein n=1 Tax=Sorangium sp. So ce302 TaxID=3133297 RepID=UPI003F5D96F2
MSRTHAVVGCLFASMVAMASTGCAVEMQDDQVDGVDPVDEDVAEVEQAYSEATCATVAPVTTYIGGYNYYSPQTYTTTACYKSLAVDVVGYEAGFTPAPGPNHELNTYVDWADTLPTDPEACRDLFLAATLYYEDDGVMAPVELAQRRGNYVNGVGCNVGLSYGLKFYTPMVATHSYRVVVTARTGNGSGFPTRKFSIRTVWEPS